MFSFSHFFIGIMFVVLGTILLKFNFRLVGITGRQSWIEDHFGSGSTYFVYQVIAILVAVSGLIYAIGYGSNVLDWLLSPLRGVFSGFKQ